MILSAQTPRGGCLRHRLIDPFIVTGNADNVANIDKTSVKELGIEATKSA